MRINEDYLDRVTSDDIEKEVDSAEEIERDFWPFSFEFFNTQHSIIEYSKFVDRLDYIARMLPEIADYDIKIETDELVADTVVFEFTPEIEESRKGLSQAFRMLTALSHTRHQLVYSAQSYFKKSENPDYSSTILCADVKEFFQFLNEPLKPGLSEDQKNRHIYYAAEIMSWLTRYKIGVCIEYLIDKFDIIRMTSKNLAHYYIYKTGTFYNIESVDVSDLDGQKIDIGCFESAGFFNGHYKITFDMVKQKDLFPAISDQRFKTVKTFNDNQFYQDMKNLLMKGPTGALTIHHPMMYRGKTQDERYEYFYSFSCYVGHATMQGYREFIYLVFQVEDCHYESKTDHWAADFIKKLTSYCEK